MKTLKTQPDRRGMLGVGCPMFDAPGRKSARRGRPPALAALILLLLLILLPATVRAQFNYDTNNGTIWGYTGPGGAVIIPSTINGLPVTSITDYAFKDCTTLTSVTIPNSVASIGGAAFAGCTSLTSVTIPNSVTSIGFEVFRGCTSLTSITIPNSVTTIGNNAFHGCTSLISITIGDRVTSIGEMAFYGCTSLRAITVDALNVSYSSVDGVLFDKDQTTLVAYSGAKDASRYTIPEGVTTIGNVAFYGCTSLTSVTIPNSVTRIGYSGFASCTNLTGVYFKGNAPFLGSRVFDGDNNATVYYLPRTTGWDTTFVGRPIALWTPSGGNVLLVSLESTNPVPPYATWKTAATNIQDAVDLAKPGDLVLVANGVYATGEKSGSRVATTNAILLESLNGPLVTRIDGGGSVRCVSLGSNAVLSGFTLTGGVSPYGAGVFCEASGVVTNCVLTANSSSLGGGAYGCTLYNCTVTGNSGGGAYGCTLYNCTVTGNSGGGLSGGTAINSILYGNTNGNYTEGTILNYCCTTPLPTYGVGNIAADPRFVNAASGNYHLRPDSPCIEAGTNLLPLITTDLEGEFRPWDGNRDGVAALDIGAYEFRPSPATLYVSLQSPNPTPPYSTWATAATNIQHAVDVAKAGDTVRVTNGVYAVGSRGNEAGETRVAVASAIRLESVNGPSVTIIGGSWNGKTGWWDGEPTGARCVYLGANAVLSGFTLTNGWAYSGGGVHCEASSVVTNCTLTGNRAYYVDSMGGFDGLGGGAYGGTLYNCTLTGNVSYGWVSWGGGPYISVAFGGGACYSTLYNCTLTGNSASAGGGGAAGCMLYNCTLTGNSAVGDEFGCEGGGGAYGSTLYNCVLTGNSAYYGRGASGTLYDCTVTGNLGDGASGTLYNCTVTGNAGGGARGTLYNCLITDNNGGSGGFLYGCTVVGNNGGILGTAFNSIVYYNSGGNYDTNTTLNYCCTTPLPTSGVGNITGPPLFMDYAAGDYRLWENSPCIDAGTNLLAVPGYSFEPTDIIGNTRFIDGDFDGIVAWDIGAYEFNSYKPPRFSHPPRLTVNGWQLNITGAHNKWVRVQRSSDLRNWEDFSGWQWMGSEGVKQVTDSDMGQRMMFYRVVVE